MDNTVGASVGLGAEKNIGDYLISSIIMWWAIAILGICFVAFCAYLIAEDVFHV